VEIRKLGSNVIPVVEFKDLKDAQGDQKMLEKIRKRGTVIVKGVMGEREALEMKEQARKYIKDNQGRVKGSYLVNFPSSARYIAERIVLQPSLQPTPPSTKCTGPHLRSAPAPTPTCLPPTVSSSPPFSPPPLLTPKST